MRIVPTSLLALSLLASSGCAKKSGLKLTLIDASVQRPSNVAVYFTVDTQDDEPVPGLAVESFRIYEDGRLVSVHESKQTILNPEVAASHNTLLLVDMSGSVTESGDVPAIVEAANSFADRVRKYQEVAVYAFDGRKDIVQLGGFTGDTERLRQSMDRLNDFKSVDPSTNLYGAVMESIKVLDRQVSRANAPLRFGTVVVFTDGTDRAGRVKREDLEKTLEKTEYDIFVIGVGDEIDEDELGTIGTSGSITTKNREEIASAFGKAAERVEAFSGRYYLLGYCSPARAGKHQVRIEAEAKGQTGSLEYEFNAQGFGPNCDPERKPRFDIKRPRPAVQPKNS